MLHERVDLGLQLVEQRLVQVLGGRVAARRAYAQTLDGARQLALVVRLIRYDQRLVVHLVLRSCAHTI